MPTIVYEKVDRSKALSLHTVRDGCTICGTITMMADNLRGKGILAEHKDGAFHVIKCIQSVDEPQLRSYCLYAWGNSKSLDNQQFEYTFESEQTAIHAIHDILALVKQINERTIP